MKNIKSYAKNIIIGAIIGGVSTTLVAALTVNAVNTAKWVHACDAEMTANKTDICSIAPPSSK